MAANIKITTSKSKPTPDPIVKIGVMPETMRLISRLLQKCEEEKKRLNSDIKLDDPIERAAVYTGLHKDVVTKISNLMEMGGTFSEVEIQEIDRMVIQKALMDFYFNDDILPTTRQLYNAVIKEIPMYVDIRMFRKELLKMNYMWKRIPNHSLVVIERPTTVFERYHYLKRIIEYRKENRLIVFVDVSFLSSGELLTLNDNDDEIEEENGYFMYAISKHQVYALEGIPNSTFKKEVFENWVRDTLSLHIPPKSVVVMNNVKYNSEEIRVLPTENSLKIEMIDWLEYHDIPCSPNMCKMELYSLIENFTNNIDKLYKIDKILKIREHDVLRIPDSIKNFTPTTFVRDLVKLNLEHSAKTQGDGDNFEKIKNIMNRIDKKTLAEYEDYVSHEEQTIFDADLKLDAKFDRMCENMKTLLFYDTEADSDIPTLSDSD